MDDGSTDDPVRVLSPYLRRVRYIPMVHRGLPAASRNRGIAATSAEYVAFLDADDWWYPRHIEAAERALSRYAEAGICYGDFAMVDQYGRTIRLKRVRAVNGDGYAALLRYDFICTSTVVVRRKCLERLGVFSEAQDLAAGCEDWELWLRIAKHFPLVHVPEPLVAYQMHSLDGSLGTGSRWLTSFEVMSRMILHQADTQMKSQIEGWHDFVRARWHLARGNMTEARDLMDKSLNETAVLDRRYLFWVLTRGTWASRLPTALRRRLGIARQATRLDTK